ncbi:MAG TPA: hypothetical protein VGM94_02470 [Galbitalea sp.]|jgi:hypothetical protein
MTASREHLARALWTLFEPIHAVTYFSDEARAGFAAIGLTRYWDGYFAGRAAPLGAVSSAPVTAIFSGFAPFLVDRALPASWALASPAVVLEARLAGAEATLRRLAPDEDAVTRAAAALAPIAARVDTVGRPLSAANASLPLADDPYRSMWQAAATLREHRGDGHVIALVGLDIAGLTTLLLRTGVDLDAGSLQKARGWTDDEWNAEADRLVDRGLLRADRTTTSAGLELLAEAERLTNRLALGPWAHLDDTELLDVARALAPVATPVNALYPRPNPIGIPLAWDPYGDPDATAVPPVPAHP